jgi:hypothetical protein
MLLWNINKSKNKINDKNIFFKKINKLSLGPSGMIDMIYVIIG